MFDFNVYDYIWTPGTDLFIQSPEILEDMAQLYSNHYGVWGSDSETPQKNIRLSAKRIGEWLESGASNIARAYYQDELIGYAIAVQSNISDYGIISWVTQFVVHESHRNKGVGKALLFSIWGLSDHFSWGVVTANPYAVRALEKATRRRCEAKRITRNHRKLLAIGSEHVPYIEQEMEHNINKTESRVNTRFFLDHSELDSMLEKVVNLEKPWKLGALPEGWEWFAFTFQDQAQIALTKDEIDAMLKASDDIVRHAYSRMQLSSAEQKWAQYTASEVDFILNYTDLDSCCHILDLGCGTGRHAIALAKRGMHVTGIDYVAAFIDQANIEAQRMKVNAEFRVDDCRTALFEKKYDIVLCLYDVIGTYANEEDNQAIVQNISKYLRPGGKAIISVMNYALSEKLATRKFELSVNPESLLQLPASSTMETTGDVFQPNHLMLDTETGIFYRREQFVSGQSLPIELIVRDKRFRRDEIARMCEDAGLRVSISCFVCAGRWESPFDDETYKGAKEILLVCEKDY